MFFSKVNFLCLIVSWYLFHPRVNAVACTTNPGHSAESAGGRLELNTRAPYIYIYIEREREREREREIAI